LVFFLRVLILLSLSPFSKRRQGSAGLAPKKALKTGLASAAGAAARHAGWLASAQGALERGAQAARVAMGQASQADPSVGAAIMPGEAADMAVASSPTDLLPVPASTPAGAVADSSAELSIAADVGMAEAPPLVVIPDLPVLGHEEKAAVVAEVGDRRPASLAEERPNTSIAAVPEALAAGGPNALVEVRVEPWPVLGSSGLIPARLNLDEWCGRPLRFWSHATSDSEPLLSLDDELEERTQDNFCEYIEVATRSLRSAMETLSRDVPKSSR
jgi:hypothetical protein